MAEVVVGIALDAPSLDDTGIMCEHKNDVRAGFVLKQVTDPDSADVGRGRGIKVSPGGAELSEIGPCILYTGRSRD